MIGDRRVLAVAAGAPVSGNSLALVEDLDRIGGDTSLDLLAGKAIGNGIIVPLDLDVIIQPGAPDTPFGKDITFDRQRSQRPDDQAPRTIGGGWRRHGAERAYH